MKKLVISLSMAAFLIAPVFASADHTTAHAIEQLRIKIAELQAQINALVQQQNNNQWCHTFNTNLKVGDSDKSPIEEGEIGNLQNALHKEGFRTGDEHSSNFPAYFGDGTASAVTGFQEKYASNILTPNGLQHGTGYVGPITRRKLNSLYGCGARSTESQFRVISPNGGETWEIGKTYSTVWTTKVPVVQIQIVTDETSDQPYLLSNGYLSSSDVTEAGKYTFTLEKWWIPGQKGNVLAPVEVGKYKVRLVTGVGGPTDSSDAPFSIVAPGTTIVAPTITSLQPTSGPVGASVTIMGSGFTVTGNKVKFGDLGSENDPNYSINSSDGKTLVFTVPSGNYFSCWYSTPKCYVAAYFTQPGTYSVSVTNANGTSNAAQFTVTSKTTGTLYLNPSSAIIQVGGTAEFQATYQPSYSCEPPRYCAAMAPYPVQATWTSSNPKVATVAYKEIPCPVGTNCLLQQFDYLTAVVTGVSLGSATITATYTDSSGAVFTASAFVTTVMQ